jgi:hypothetical protein
VQGTGTHEAYAVDAAGNWSDPSNPIRLNLGIFGGDADFDELDITILRRSLAGLPTQ